MIKIISKYTLMTLTLLISVGAFSQQQQNEFYISTSTGASKLIYGLNTGKNTLELGSAFGLGYKYYFSESIGLGAGLEWAVYKGGFSSDKLNYKENVHNYAIGDIAYSAVFSEYREKQRATMMNIPIMVNYQTSGKHKFYAAAGTKLSFPLGFSSKQAPVKQIVASGYAPLYDAPLTDIPYKGFGTFERSTEQKLNADQMGLKSKINAMISAEFGMKWDLDKNINLYTAAYLDYGLGSVSRLAKQNDKKDFMPYYAMSATADDNDKSPIVVNSVLNSRYDYDAKGKAVDFTKNDKITPYIIGIKLSLSFSQGKRFVKPDTKENI